MAIVEPKKENHIFVCLPLLVSLLVPPAATAATAATSGAGIGDGDVDADSFMVALRSRRSRVHPLQNDKESGKTITLKGVYCKASQPVFSQPHLNSTSIFMSHLLNMYFLRKQLYRYYQNLFILIPYNL